MTVGSQFGRRVELLLMTNDEIPNDEGMTKSEARSGAMLYALGTLFDSIEFDIRHLVIRVSFVIGHSSFVMGVALVPREVFSGIWYC